MLQIRYGFWDQAQYLVSCFERSKSLRNSLQIWLEIFSLKFVERCITFRTSNQNSVSERFFIWYLPPLLQNHRLITIIPWPKKIPFPKWAHILTFVNKMVQIRGMSFRGQNFQSEVFWLFQKISRRKQNSKILLHLENVTDINNTTKNDIFVIFPHFVKK